MNRPSSPWMTGSVTDHFDDRPDPDQEFSEYSDVEDFDADAGYGGHDDFDDYDEHVDEPRTTTAAGCGWPLSPASCCSSPLPAR